MTFDNRTRELIALGASVAANCESCVEHHRRKATDYGVDPQDVAQAIDIGRAVRQAASKATMTACCSMMSGGWPCSMPWGGKHEEEKGAGT